MTYRFNSLEELTEHFRALPGIGGKSAQRLAFHVLNMPERDARAFAEAILRAKDSVKYCKDCQNLTENDLCPICTDPSRDRTVVCVVQTPADLMAVEKTRGYKGLYHVLHGAISPTRRSSTRWRMWASIPTPSARPAKTATASRSIPRPTP